jgi:hypothetical protein
LVVIEFIVANNKASGAIRTAMGTGAVQDVEIAPDGSAAFSTRIGGRPGSLRFSSSRLDLRFLGVCGDIVMSVTKVN